MEIPNLSNFCYNTTKHTFLPFLMKYGPKHLFVLALGAMTVIPLASTQARFRSIDDEGRFVEKTIDLHKRAITDQSANFRYRRRAYSRAMVEFRKRRQAGEKDLTPPDINNIESYEKYLTKIEHDASGGRLRSAAPVKQEITPKRSQVREHPILNTRTAHEAIGRRERVLLQFYRDAGYCPDPVASALPAVFNQLCERIVEEKKASPKLGILSDLARIKMRNAAPPATVKLRLKMIEEANDRSTRRQDLLPTNYR